MSQEREGERNSWMTRITPIAAIAFASLLIGMTLPVLVFGQRLAIQEERMRVTVEGVSELRDDVRALGDRVGELRESLAVRNTQQRGRQ